jgi:tetrahydromethanopterin S-methyltransferase subunit B
MSVALTLVVMLWPILAMAQPVGPAGSTADSLWIKVLLPIVLGLVAGFFGLWQSQRKFKQDIAMMNEQRREDLTADMSKIERQITEQLKADVRTQAARLRERYVNALPFHTRLLTQQMAAVRDKLAHDHDHKMQRWFKKIKEYCEARIDRDDPRAGEFSAWCHYEGVFAMSTLYYTSVFFLYSQQLRSLSPFSELDASFGKNMEGYLQQVGDAFARRGINEEAAGLWDPVQDNMGAMVRKDDWYKSYPEFCRIFIEVSPRREDHVFLRALDFFGAHGGPADPPQALLDKEGAETIVTALDDLLHFLAAAEATRWGTSAELAPPYVR